MLDKLKARWSERSTHAGLGFLLGTFGVSALCLLFPEYATIINMIAGTLGFTAVAVPTGGKSDA